MLLEFGHTRELVRGPDEQVLGTVNTINMHCDNRMFVEGRKLGQYMPAIML